MKKICLIASFSLIALVNASAQGKGHTGGPVPGVNHVPSGSTPGAIHSDAPADQPLHRTATRGKTVLKM